MHTWAYFERKSTFLTAFGHREKRTAACLLDNIFIAVVSECLCQLRAQYPVQLPDTCINGLNLVGVTGNVSPHFFRRGDVIYYVHFFLFFSLSVLFLEKFQK